LRAEQRADRLALELLAPAEIVQVTLAKQDGIFRSQRLHLAAQVLENTFGLPEIIANRYARVLLRDALRPTVREWLGV
jgi:hypothetical protein